jgi:hypothetical protein
MVFWNFVGFGIVENAISEELLCNMRCRPTTPEELPSPAGCFSFAERSNSAAELIAPPATTTTSAEYVSTVPSRSTTTRCTERPEASVSSRVTSARVRSVTFGYCSAGSTQTICESALPFTRHG